METTFGNDLFQPRSRHWDAKLLRGIKAEGRRASPQSATSSKHCKLSPVHAVADSFALDRSALRVMLLGRDRAVDIKGC